MRQAGLEDLPRFVEPMLPIAGLAPTSDDWAMEVKWDGIRAQLRFDRHAVCVRSRTGRDCTGQFPELEAIAEQLPRLEVILDGELVCFGAEGKSDFPALRTRLVQREGRAPTAAEHVPVTLVVFDVLHLSGRAVRELPYARRRELLAELALDGSAWQTPAISLTRAKRCLWPQPSTASRGSSPNGSTAATPKAGAAGRGSNRNIDAVNGCS
jgi:bifunctional non-homologous end joining protein LigD